MKKCRKQKKGANASGTGMDKIINMVIKSKLTLNREHTVENVRCYRINFT